MLLDPSQSSRTNGEVHMFKDYDDLGVEISPTTMRNVRTWNGNDLLLWFGGTLGALFFAAILIVIPVSYAIAVPSDDEIARALKLVERAGYDNVYQYAESGWSYGDAIFIQATTPNGCIVRFKDGLDAYEQPTEVYVLNDSGPSTFVRAADLPRNPGWNCGRV
jgi:hypothetical protein